MRGRPSRNKKYGLGNFCYSAFSAALLATTGPAFAEPVAIELVGAAIDYDQRTNAPVISFKMSPASTKQFAEMTQKNVGHRFEMRIDGKPIVAPVIREPILGGIGQIHGHFTEQEARDVAARLSSGTSKLEFEIID